MIPVSKVVHVGDQMFAVPTEPEVPRTPKPANGSKLLLSSVLNMAGRDPRSGSASRVESHGCDFLFCDPCKSRLLKLDELERKQEELEMMEQIYQKKLELSTKLLEEYKLKERTFLDNMAKLFCGDQLLRILTGHCVKRRGGQSWDDVTIKKAAKLYFVCSPQGYQELLTLNLPLPSAHTLQGVIQRGRPNPCNSKSSVFDPFTTGYHVNASIAVVKKDLMQQTKQKAAAMGRVFAIKPAPAAGNMAGPSPKQESEPRKPNYLGRMSKLKANEDHLNQGFNSIIFPEEEILEEVHPDPEHDTVCILEDSTDFVQQHVAVDVQLDEEEVSPISSLSSEPSIRREVGAVVRSLVSSVSEMNSDDSGKPKAPYVSILRNLTDPSAPPKYNLVVPRSLLRAGQKIVLKTPGQGPPTVHIINQTATVSSEKALKRPPPSVGLRVVKRSRP